MRAFFLGYDEWGMVKWISYERVLFYLLLTAEAGKAMKSLLQKAPFSFLMV
jgi:hypothetical protein